MAVFSKVGSFMRPPLTYVATGSFGAFGSGNGQLNAPEQIVPDGSGNIHVADKGNNRLQRFTSGGSYGASITGLANTTGVAIDPPDSDLYVCYDSGTFSNFARYDLATLTLENTGTIQRTSHMAYMAYLGSDVVTTHPNNTVAVRTGSGFASNTWGSAGSGNGQFSNPIGVSFDGVHVYVVDSGNNRVQKFTAAGAFVAKWGSAGAGAGQFNAPRGIAVDAANDRVYIADTGNHRVQVFDRAGTFLAAFGSVGSGAGQLNSPRSVAIESTGDLLVSEAGNHRIQRFTRSMQTVVTGLGFQPKAIVWLGSNNLTSGTVRANAELAIGWTARETATGAPVTRSLGIFSQDAATIPATRVKARDDLGLDNNGVVLWRSTDVTFDPDGFTVTWAPSPYDGEQERIAFLAYG